MNNYTRDQKRFWSNVTKTDTCWLWNKTYDDGYGRFWAQGKFHQAHRWAYEQEHGVVVPVHLVVDHGCRVHACVRPSHLEPVTQSKNIRRAERKPRSRMPSVEPTPDKPKHKAGSRPRYCRACLRPAAECGSMKDRLCEPCRTEHTTKARNVLDGLMNF